MSDAKPAAVQMAPAVTASTSEIESREMDETEFLLSNPENARRLRQSIAQIRAGTGDYHRSERTRDRCVKLTFSEKGWQQYSYWQDVDPKMLKRLNRVIGDTLRSPYEGIGKPEALKGDLKGFWSRRIDGEHRQVYTVEGDSLLIAQCRHHY